jgi:plastocyanin
MRLPGTKAQVVAPLATLTMLLCAAPASADEQITAGPPNQYLTPAVTIDQGEKVTFMNSDPAEHDVLSRDLGPDEKALFRSELVGAGGTVPVEGVEYLTTGSYAFFCSIHPQMEGTLNVSSAGTPVPRPTEPGPGPGPGTGSTLSVQVLDTKRKAVKKRGSLRVRVTTGGAATVRLTAQAKGKAFAKGTAKLAGAGKKTARLKLTRAGRRAVKRAGSIAVAVTAKAKGADKATASGTLS